MTSLGNRWYTCRVMARKKVATSVSAPVSTAVPARRVKSPTFMLGILGLGLLVAVGAILLGRSDTGQIDVAATVRNAGTVTDANGNQVAPVNVPAEEFRNMPNGGLVPQDPNAAPAPEPIPTEVATTTEDGTASTTPESHEAPETPEENVEEPETETPAEETAGE